MHISEGVLSGPVLISGMAIAAAGTAIGIKKLDLEHIARAGVLSAAFFVASLIHVPVGPASVHLILNGIIGLLLGWGAFPTIMVALLLQVVFFQFGGLTTLGVNTVIMALPAVVCYYLFTPLIMRRPAIALPAAFFCGFLAVFFSALLLGISLMFTEENFFEVAVLAISAHLPVMVIEGIITVFCLNFLKKVSPELLSVSSSGDRM
ncbi:MAG: cobalt transporter CbiM [Deltaproteobacteria bacterium]|nr:cobalt transporter CbiM [Candidatus Anaeroferrophillus wilburensis]MBN2888260.1 cobalt transporter CbiM [Deltaproteobacteria bacterium]